MIASRAIAGPVWDRVGVEFTDDSGRTVSAEVTPTIAVVLAQELAEVANGFRSNDVVSSWAIGQTVPLKAKPGKGYGEIHWGDRHRNRLRIHPARLREVADMLHDLADRAEG